MKVPHLPALAISLFQTIPFRILILHRPKHSPLHLGTSATSYAAGVTIKAEVTFFSQSPVKETELYNTIGTGTKTRIYNTVCSGFF